MLAVKSGCDTPLPNPPLQAGEGAGATSIVTACAGKLARFPPMRHIAMTTPASSPANAQQRYEVRRADLPLSCPQPSMALWNSHPRVYLPIEEEGGNSQCPYCGATYVLVD